MFRTGKFVHIKLTLKAIHFGSAVNCGGVNKSSHSQLKKKNTLSWLNPIKQNSPFGRLIQTLFALMFPFIKHKLWRDNCTSYFDKLAEESDDTKIRQNKY